VATSMRPAAAAAAAGPPHSSPAAAASHGRGLAAGRFFKRGQECSRVGLQLPAAAARPDGDDDGNRSAARKQLPGCVCVAVWMQRLGRWRQAKDWCDVRCPGGVWFTRCLLRSSEAEARVFSLLLSFLVARAPCLGAADRRERARRDGRSCATRRSGDSKRGADRCGVRLSAAFSLERRQGGGSCPAPCCCLLRAPVCSGFVS